MGDTDRLAALLDPENAPARHGEWHPAHRPMGRDSVVLTDEDGCDLFIEPWEVAVMVNGEVDRAAGVTVAPQPGGLDVERAAFPWHRETIGHASVDQIAESVAASLHRNDNTDATWLVDSEDRIVAFIGNGPRQTDNGDLILAAIAREYGLHPQCRERIDTKKAGPEGPASPEADAPRGLATVEAYAPAHVLVGLTCWCRPYPDREDPEVIIHRLEGKA